MTMNRRRAASWNRMRTGAPTPGSSCPFVVAAIAAEFRKCVAATHRYEQLKRTMPKAGDPCASAARQIYVEYYSEDIDVGKTQRGDDNAQTSTPRTSPCSRRYSTGRVSTRNGPSSNTRTAITASNR
jgi:hypothetical protein